MDRALREWKPTDTAASITVISEVRSLLFSVPLVVSGLCLEMQITRAAVPQPPFCLERGVCSGSAFFPSWGAAG